MTTSAGRSATRTRQPSASTDSRTDAFLSDYYSGAFPGSDARGLGVPGEPGDRRPPDQRYGGLAGRPRAGAGGRDPRRVDLAVRRLLLAHHVMLGFGGLPLLYMGDEVALVNDYSYRRGSRARGRQPLGAPPTHAVGRRGAAQHARDDRAPCMAWDSPSGRSTFRPDPMHASIEAELLEPVNPAVFAILRRHPGGALVALFNMTEYHQWWPRWAVPLERTVARRVDRRAAAGGRSTGSGSAPYDALWLTSS